MHSLMLSKHFKSMTLPKMSFFDPDNIAYLLKTYQEKQPAILVYAIISHNLHDAHHELDWECILHILYWT